MAEYCENQMFVKGSRKDIEEFVAKYCYSSVVEEEENCIVFEKILPDREEWTTRWTPRDYHMTFYDNTEMCKDEDCLLSVLYYTDYNPNKPVIKQLIEDNKHLDIKNYYFEPSYCFFGCQSSNEAEFYVEDKEEVKKGVVEFLGYSEEDFDYEIACREPKSQE